MLRVLKNTDFEESSFKFIYNYLHFFVEKMIHVYKLNWKLEKNNTEFFITTSHHFLNAFCFWKNCRYENINFLTALRGMSINFDQLWQ